MWMIAWLTTLIKSKSNVLVIFLLLLKSKKVFTLYATAYAKQVHINTVRFLRIGYKKLDTKNRATIYYVKVLLTIA